MRLLLKEPVEGATSFDFAFPGEDVQEKAKNLITKKVSVLLALQGCKFTV